MLTKTSGLAALAAVMTMNVVNAESLNGRSMQLGEDAPVFELA